MAQTFLGTQQRVSSFFTRRWLVVFSGLLVQIVVVILVGISFGQPEEPTITLAPLVENPGACRVVHVIPFTDAWLSGMQAGEIVQVSGANAGTQSCLTANETIHVHAVGPERVFVANAAPLHVDFLGVTLAIMLTIIFNVMGISIFLRALNRPVAHVTYGLFYCASLMFFLLGVQRVNYLWVDVLLFVMAMVVRGLSTTFVCLFPRASSTSYGQGRAGRAGQVAQKRAQLLLYSPLIAAIALVLVGVPLLMQLPQLRFEFLLVTFIYNIVCLGFVFWTLFWGLRKLSTREKQLTRMVVIGILFLLLPLALSLNIIRSDSIAQPGLVHLLSIPLAALPLAYGYAVFRHQLVGMTSLVSRQVMRILLWLLLASIFVFPCIVLLRFINTSFSVSGDLRVYIFAGTLILSMWLFPLAWNKVRDMGDQVFYRDFYRYNHSLRDLSTTLTRLQGLDQISAFVLPSLAQLLNATDIALLVHTARWEDMLSNVEDNHTLEDNHTFAAPWHIYRQDVATHCIATERLISIAHLAVTHREHPSYEPLVLDGVLLLALYDGDTLTGFLCLGPKKNLEPYSRQDTSFLATLAAQLSVLEVNSRYLAQAQADAQKLTALNRRVVSTQEDERRHLALELHDEALQHAMLVVRQLSDASTMTEVADVMPLARSVVSSLRHTCLELRPPLLDELGLEEALHWLAQQTRQHGSNSGIRMEIQIVCEGLDHMRLPADSELALYRVAQEALSNALKYARASKVAVRLRSTPRGTISLIVADNGRGFKRKHSVKDSLGLVGMHERMLAIGGRLHIRASQGHGVAVRATYSQAEPSAVEEARQDLLPMLLR
ncbi:MAG: sensor histidine kinase [Ktedonobacteraceae bacterium]